MNLARRQPSTAGAVLPGLAYGRENSIVGPLDFPKVSLHMVEGPSSGAIGGGSKTWTASRISRLLSRLRRLPLAAFLSDFDRCMAHDC